MGIVRKERIVDPFFEDAINQIFIQSDKTAFVMDGSIGSGKALANSENVLTPQGYVPMYILNEGDEVISEDGTPTTITGVHPQGVKPIFKITFKNGTTVRCTSDHLWKVKCLSRNDYSIMTTQEIIEYGVSRPSGVIKKNGESEVQYLTKVPLPKPCHIDNKKELPLDPYLMGALLGDGGFTHEAVSFTNGTKEIFDRVESLLPDSVKFTTHYQGNAWHGRIRGVSRCRNIVNKCMRQLDLWGKYSHEKHIPERYKNSSLENRKQLLQGLIDTDGHILKNGTIEYNTSSPLLIKDFCYVARSLGMEMGKVTTKIPTYTYKGEKKKGKKSYRVCTLLRPSGHSTIVNIELDGHEEATCIVIDHPSKLFVTNGFNLTHNSSNFVMQGAYNVSQLVAPIKKGTRMVRETKWAAVRESENSALATIRQLLGEAIFTPEIMAMENSPVIVKGSHPATVTVSHDLPDGTELEMVIECHGFNNEAAHNRLRTHEFMGAMIFEMQGIPFNIFEVTQERCGRFRTSDMSISKTIDGKKYTLSGLTKLAMVLCDVNIPERPHPLYTEYYDKTDKSKIPYLFLTPPSPLLYKPTADIPNDKLKELSKKYPITRFEAEEVIWFPNPKAYNMTRHFEEKDENGVNIPWSGFNYWFKRLHRTDSEIRRYVLGIPDTVGGEQAIYKTFRNDDSTVYKRELNYNRPVYVGYDPGGYAAVVMGQSLPNSVLHYFREFIFEPSDGVSTRLIFSDYVFPYCNKYLKNFDIVMVPDPASSWLGKSVMAGQTESVINMVMDELRIFKEANPNMNFNFKILPCMVSNQNTDARINSLGYFIDKGFLSIDPSCEVLVAALSGGYQKKKLKSGIISDNIDKDNPYSHPAEAAQYPAVNILNNLQKVSNANKNRNKRRIYKVSRPAR